MLDLQIGGSEDGPTEKQVRKIVSKCQSALEAYWGIVRDPATNEIIPPDMNDPRIEDYLDYMDYAAHKLAPMIQAHVPEKYWSLIEELTRDWLPAPRDHTR